MILMCTCEVVHCLQKLLFIGNKFKTDITLHKCINLVNSDTVLAIVPRPIRSRVYLFHRICTQIRGGVFYLSDHFKRKIYLCENYYEAIKTYKTQLLNC